LCVRHALVPAELTTGPFTTAEAARLGVTAAALRSEPWVHMLRGVWRHRDVADTREERVAAVRLLLTPHAVVCALTAAWLQGIDVQDPRNRLVWVACQTGHRMRRRPGLMMRELTLAPADVVSLCGLAVTNPLRTAFDCARWLSPVEAVVVLDALSHLQLICLDDVRDYTVTHPGLRWVTRVRHAVDLADPLSESPMESRLRLLLVRAGIHSLRPQVVVRDGDFTARLDLADEQLMVAAEYDGSDHWMQRREDDRRRDRLRALGWTIIVVSAEDYYSSSTGIVANVRAALAAARRRLT
jgi:very-short-patch-repair endonuclease